MLAALAAVLIAQASIGQDSGYLRGAHYFGDAWPVNFWDSFSPAAAPADFRRIRDEGFNTIVLVVPWGQFQPSISPPRYDERMFERLSALMRTAGAAKLRVVLRVGYEWDFAPDVELHFDRYIRVFTDDQVHAAWVAFLAELQRRVATDPAYAFSFLSWEDFWGVSHVTRGSEAERLAGAGSSGFRAWVRKHRPLPEVSAAMRASFRTWEEVPVPAERKPGFELFLAYMDDLLMERLFKPGQRALPSLSMEVRADQDPVFDGDKVTWIPHYATYALPGAPYTTTYYAVSMGASEPAIPAAHGVQLMRSMLSSIKERAKSGLFIDQFVPYDNTPAFESNPKIAAAELPRFVEDAGQVLEELAAGYAVWTWRDYASSVIYNARFELGLRGWQASGGARLRGGQGVQLRQGGTLRQSIDEQRTGVATFAPFPKAKLCFWAQPSSKSPVLAIDFGHGELRHTVAAAGEQCLEAPVQRSYELAFRAATGDLSINNIRLYAFVGSGKFHALDGSPLELLAPIRAVNARLAGIRVPEHFDRASVTQLTGVSPDSWMGPSASGRLQVPGDLSSRTFRISTSLPDTWPAEPTLHLEIGGVPLEVPCKRGGGTLQLPASGMHLTAGSIATLQITSSQSVIPKERGINADERKLACQLLDLGFSPLAAPASSSPQLDGGAR